MAYMSMDQALELKNRLWSYIKVMQDYYKELLQAGSSTQKDGLMTRGDPERMRDLLFSYTGCIRDIREYLWYMKDDVGQIRPEFVAVIDVLISKLANDCSSAIECLKEKMTSREVPGNNDSDEITRPEGIKDIFEDETFFQGFTSDTNRLCEALSLLYERLSSEMMEEVYAAPHPGTWN